MRIFTRHLEEKTHESVAASTRVREACNVARVVRVRGGRGGMRVRIQSQAVR